MSKISAMVTALRKWYVIVPLLAVVAVALGSYVILDVFPGKPQIGVITIPFTVINEESSFVITTYLDYARRNPRIKAVVITLSSPGGGATSSERLYLETRRLREDKPVVIVMNGLVASGGFMMAMGANYTFAKTSSLVGNVGVVSSVGPLVPSTPPESIVFTGPSKLTGSTRRDWIGLMDLLKQSFTLMVISERGEKLRITPEELVEGRLYSGMEAVRLGLADEIGDNSAAIDKAASLAKISNYELLDVNVEVDRLFVQKIRRIFAASDAEEAALGLSTFLALTQSDIGNQGSLDSRGSLDSAAGLGADQNQTVSLGQLRSFMISGMLSEAQEDPLPDFPLEINRPKIYYLYAGQSP